MAASEREPISLGLRFRVFVRDHFSCRYCGVRPPGVTLELDHVVPVADGGHSVEENLVTACDRCNGGKGAKPVPELLARAAWIHAVVDVTSQTLDYAEYWGDYDSQDSDELLEDYRFDLALGPTR